LEPISVDSEQIESDRDAALAAVHAGVTALLSSRDEFSQHSAVANTTGLQSADQQVNAVLNQLGGSR
jgi:hypothetical protein